uniref:Uncharacterized protein n=1 Tax=Trachysalambria curvirostris majanivirus TaxID=2984281 RepID=A0A9C7C918_9VIRU|nr:MAG: hypothetical protein [Trachysalambria curvirostris majanivirus]
MREYDYIYYSSMTGLLPALTEAGFPISVETFKHKENIESTYGDDGISLTEAPEESLCLSLYCALGLLLERGIKVKVSKSNNKILENFPSVSIIIKPNISENSIVWGRIKGSNSYNNINNKKINKLDIHNGVIENNKKEKYLGDFCETLIITSKGRGKDINKSLSTTLYIDSTDKEKLSFILKDIAEYPLKFFRAIILRGNKL